MLTYYLVAEAAGVGRYEELVLTKTPKRVSGCQLMMVVGNLIYVNLLTVAGSL